MMTKPRFKCDAGGEAGAVTAGWRTMAVVVMPVSLAVFSAAVTVCCMAVVDRDRDRDCVLMTVIVLLGLAHGLALTVWKLIFQS
jgi:hypothetical protein